MNYELAKKLAESGFPGMSLMEVVSSNINETKLTHVFEGYVPTLSKLIEACGEEFAHLKRYHPSNIWEAATDGFEQQGQTPLEAVANLWLALNKK